MNEQKNIQNFLEQQKTLFGNELFLNKIGQSDEENITLSTGQNGKRDLDQFCNSISFCKECELGNTRNNFVFGTDMKLNLNNKISIESGLSISLNNEKF